MRRHRSIRVALIVLDTKPWRINTVRDGTLTGIRTIVRNTDWAGTKLFRLPTKGPDEMDNYDVIVIGYGPVGQMAAAQLGQAGFTVGSFERHAQMYGLSRAGHIDDEIMRTLDRVGAGEEFREDAVAWQLYDMRNKAFGGDLLLSLDWSQIGPHGHRGHWIFYQNNLELALNRQVEATGNVSVNFSHEVIDFVQDADGVTVNIRNDISGDVFPARAKYLIGADGANSFVRQRLGITTTEGVTGPQPTRHRYPAEAGA